MKMHKVADMIPNNVHTRHSEGAFIRLNDGRIMFAYSRFTSSQNDDAPSDIVAYFSSDEGETWDDERLLIAASTFGTQNVMSVSLLRLANGDVGLFYIIKQTPSVSRIMLSRSSDECRSFYKHTECTSPDRAGYYVLNNDRVERLSSGRIILPLAFHRSGNVKDGETRFLDPCSYDCFLYSDDDGATWAEAPGKAYPPFNNTNTGLQEPGVIEKQNGVVWAYSRTDKMYQYEFFSMDGGMTWTLPQPSRFTSPPSPMKITRHPVSGALYAFWNPVPIYNGRNRSKSGWGRTPIVYAVSCDDGVNWSDCRSIEGGEEHGYCYPAVFFTDDDAMLVAYCSGGPDDGCCLARLTIMKLPCNGKDVL